MSIAAPTVEATYRLMQEKLHKVVPDFELKYKAELVYEINKLKEELGAVILFANPDTLTLDFPWGTHDAASKWEAILLIGIVAITGAWQFFSLNNEAARAAFDPPPDEEAAHE